MMKTLYILGRQPDIGIAELESLLGATSLRSISNIAVAAESDPDYIPFSRLGGSIKVCKILTTLPYTDWDKLVKYLLDVAPQFLQYLPEGKLHLGVSVYGLQVNPKSINASALSLKKVIKQAGKSVRIVPNVEKSLNSAQVIHNKLTGPSGWELVLIRDGSQTILGQTTAVQDINAYAARDQARPKRDARVGMLPPKLAQIIINLASHGNNRYGATVLDPFCGTGVVLQEALLMGFDALGGDIDHRMVEYAQENMKWLASNGTLRERHWQISDGDATNSRWQQRFDFVAGETYLGRPFSATPDTKTLDQVMSDVALIHRKFLINIAKQTPPGLRLCLAVPAWNIKGRFKHLKTLDSLEDLGYTRQSFVHASNEKLIYHREGQIVGRELVVLTRK